MVARTCTPEARPDRTAPSGLGAPLVIKPVLSMVFNRVLLVALLVLAAAVPAACSIESFIIPWSCIRPLACWMALCTSATVLPQP